MKMYVLEARDENKKVICRAEYDNKKYTKKWFDTFEAKDAVKSIRVFEDDVETMNWQRES